MSCEALLDHREVAVDLAGPEAFHSAVAEDDVDFLAESALDRRQQIVIEGELDEKAGGNLSSELRIIDFVAVGAQL